MKGGWAYLSNAEELSSMREAPMAQFMAEHCDHFLRFALLDESIVNDNMFLPWQAKEISIAMCTPLTSINDIQAAEWELQPF